MAREAGHEQQASMYSQAGQLANVRIWVRLSSLEADILMQRTSSLWWSASHAFADTLRQRRLPSCPASQPDGMQEARPLHSRTRALDLRLLSEPLRGQDLLRAAVLEAQSAYIDTYIHIHIQTYIHTYIYTYIHICIRTYITLHCIALQYSTVQYTTIH